MGKSLISNPPYNMKWSAPLFAQIQSRFVNYGVPPDSNANYAFILTGLEQIDEKGAFLLPNGILSTDNKQEAEIRKKLIENNLIEAVLTLPDKMFESTTISTCILIINKHKKTAKVEMVDMRQEYSEEQRDQNGQYGGASHERRTYHKSFKVLTDKGMDKAVNAVKELANIPNFCTAASIKKIREKNYVLTPSRYIDFQECDERHRDFKDIAADYNRIIAEKNALKLTVNESLAKAIGIYEIYLMIRDKENIADSFAIVGQKAEKENFIRLSKNAAEFKIENKRKDRLPEILSLFLTMWKQHIMYLNNEENRVLAEFRDALLPDLMSGKIVTSKEEVTK